MKRRSHKALMLLAFVLPGFAGAAGQEATINLSLDDCIVMAMRNNLGVAIAVLDPEFGGHGVSLARERFLPVLSFNVARSDERQPSYSWYDASDEVAQNYDVSSLAVRKLLSTGGDLALEFSTSKYDTNERAITINPSYRSLLRFDFRQPLLKDSGRKNARKEIVIARNSLDITKKGMERTLQETVYRVEEAFWNLVNAAEDLKIKEGSLRLAQDLLDRNLKAVKAETMASVNVLNAQVQVASREAEIFKAEADVRNAEDELRLIINLAAENKDADLLRIIPQGTMSTEKKDLTLEDAMAIALQNRPDLEALRIGVRTDEVQVRYAKNQALPDLSLKGSLWSPGVSGTRLIYPDDDPFSDPIDRIPGGRSGSLSDVFGFKHPSVSFGFSLDIPVSGLTSRAALAQAKVGLEQGTLELEKLKQEVQTRIKIALRDTVMNYNRIQALKTATELAQKQLRAEEDKFRAGYSTTYFVLQYQAELSSQQSQELAATIAYNLSLAGLSRELGTSLVEKNIRIDQVTAK
jgi:outer membrane protein TolC